MKRTGLNSWRSWIVAVSCGIIYCLFATIYRLAAIFYAAFVDNFNIDRKSASIPFVVLGFVRCSSGSIYGILGERFGLCRMALIGCYLSVIGLVASFFAQDVIALSITIGLIYGFGMTCTALLPSIIRSHFDHNATTISNGILNLGPAICGIAFPGVLMHFLDVYGVSGTLLLTSGILLNSLPLIMILKNPENNAAKVETAVTQNNKMNKTVSQQDKQPSDINDRKKQLLQPGTETNQININKDSDDQAETQQLNDSLNIERITASAIEKNIPKCLRHDPERCACLSLLKKERTSETFVELNETKMCHAQQQIRDHSKYSQPDSKVTDTVSTSSNNTQETIYNECATKKQSTGAAYDKHKEKNRSFFHSLNVLKDPTFMALTFIQGIAVYTYNIWLTTLIDYSRDKEIDRSYEIYILTLNPITDIIGRLAFTWVIDKGYLSIANFGALLFISISVSSIWLAVANNFAMLSSGIMLMTLTSGAFLNICPGMSYAYIEKDKQILSIASYGSLYAPLSFTVAPLIGYFRGKLGSYDGLYYLVATMNFACSLVVLMLPMLANRREKRKIKKNIRITQHLI